MYINGDIAAAKEALDDIPPRAEEELDPVGSANSKCFGCSITCFPIFCHNKV